MDMQHPWTRYEVARLRHEERLRRARDAMRVLEARGASQSEPDPEGSRRLGSLFGRARLQKARTPAADAHSRAT
jgi:hypothetical protein